MIYYTTFAWLLHTFSVMSVMLNTGFTLLALDLPASAPQDLQPSPVQAIMQCFGWDDMLHPLLVTRYLPHLLQNRYNTVEHLSGSAGRAGLPMIHGLVMVKILASPVHMSKCLWA